MFNISIDPITHLLKYKLRDLFTQNETVFDWFPSAIINLLILSFEKYKTLQFLSESTIWRISLRNSRENLFTKRNSFREGIRNTLKWESTSRNENQPNSDPNFCSWLVLKLRSFGQRHYPLWPQLNSHHLNLFRLSKRSPCMGSFHQFNAHEIVYHLSFLSNISFHVDPISASYSPSNHFTWAKLTFVDPSTA